MTGARFLSYIDGLLAELDQLERDYLDLLAESTIVVTNHPDYMISWALHAWAPSNPSQEALRMGLLARLRDVKPRFLLLFPHPTPEITKRHDDAFQILEGWLTRPYDDHSVPATISEAESIVRSAFRNLAAGKDLLAAEEFSMHIIVDTNVLLDDPDLARFSQHPAATAVVVTGDLNLQTKLSAVRLPFHDPET